MTSTTKPFKTGYDPTAAHRNASGRHSVSHVLGQQRSPHRGRGSALISNYVPSGVSLTELALSDRGAIPVRGHRNRTLRSDKRVGRRAAFVPGFRMASRHRPRLRRMINY